MSCWRKAIRCLRQPGVKKAEVADLDEAFGKNMVQKAVDEFFGRHVHPFCQQGQNQGHLLRMAFRPMHHCVAPYCTMNFFPQA